MQSLCFLFNFHFSAHFVYLWRIVWSTPLPVQFFLTQSQKNTCYFLRNYNILMFLQKLPPVVFFKKKVFLEVLQNSQENTCPRVYFWWSYRPDAPPNDCFCFCFFCDIMQQYHTKFVYILGQFCRVNVFQLYIAIGLLFYYNIFQARSQEFFRAGEVSAN